MTKFRPAATLVAIGHLLREWRAARRFSQLDLALATGVSARHLSCIETGKAQGSRALLMRLANVLEMPPRERNALLRAGGFIPSVQESCRDTSVRKPVNQAIRFILDKQEPYPALLLNRHWDVLAANRAAGQVSGFLLDGRPGAHTNLLRAVFDPDGIRGRMRNWEVVAGTLIGHLHTVVAGAPIDQRARALLAEVLAYPGVPSRWRLRDLDAPPAPLFTIEFGHRGVELSFFATLTTFGTPRDVCADELHIAACFPMHHATAAHCRQLAED